MLSNKTFEIIHQIGSALFLRGLNHSQSGNISMRVGNDIYITRRGSMKGFLKKNDIVTVGMKESIRDKLASTEMNVHRAIYQKTDAKAIIHCHAPLTIALAFSRRAIIPIDLEGALTLPKIPVLRAAQPTASQELEDRLPPLLQEYHSAVINGHGIFTIGATLEDAFHYATLTEYISTILYYSK